jgi:hypothetical protein
VPDDGTSPVGSDEWNANPDAQGMLGFSPATSSITIAGGALLVTDSVCVVVGQGASADDIDTITLTNTNEYDLLYLFGQSGYNVTLKDSTGALNVNGEIATISGADEVLSSTVPTILIRKGNYWYGYGGGTASDLDTTNFAASAIVTASETIGSNDNDTTLPTSAAVKAYVDASPVGDITAVTAGTGLTGGGTTAAVTLNVIGGTGITANADDIAIDSTVTTLLGSQTLSSKTLTSPIINVTSDATGDIYYRNASGVFTRLAKGSDAEVLTLASGLPSWAAAGGAIDQMVKFSNAGAVTTYAGLTGESQTIGTLATDVTNGIGLGNRDVYIRKIDANNEGVFTVIHKNGALVEVQIA